ncbi:hypothetical protein FD12_GL001099 [Lentilactobacillus rapi DSM 19907 = JCM 15042]|uniref:Uncharacterized protein n=1 Tax=Lentilactobacillus rapi DSM 19907 = JCM 15042 TaxID=1423795 RepID=A0ABR5PFP0_9LACO|nr:hypothetical protein FD12_GL001099 [Lentilactobacillus rapi DSM 19907 = JCM 15042]
MLNTKIPGEVVSRNFLIGLLMLDWGMVLAGLAAWIRTAPPSRNFHISTPIKNPQNQGFLLGETYATVPNRLDPLTFLRTAA